MFERSKTKMLYSPALLVAIALICVYIVPQLFAHHMPLSKDGQPFDSHVWKMGYSWNVHLLNSSMLDDFIARYKLVGLSRRQLHELLSCHGLTTERIERLEIDRGSCTDLRVTYLEIDFDDWWTKNPLAQTAKRFRLVRERLIWGKADPEITASDWYN